MIGPSDAVAAARNLQSHCTSNVCNVAQAAALAAVSGPLDAVVEMRRNFDRRRRTMHALLSGIDGLVCPEPEGAFYAYPDASALLGRDFGGAKPATTLELADLLLDRAKVAVVPGEAFGAGRRAPAVVRAGRRRPGRGRGPDGRVPRRRLMSDPVVAPYGEWPSPVTAASLVQGAAGISEVIADPVRPWLLWWAESRPDEGGRTAVMRRDLRGSQSQEVTPEGANVRTRVHEYGGGAWWPHDGALYYVDFADQRLRRLDRPGADPVLLTAEPPEPRAWRYADGRVTPDGRWCVCVRERHDTGGEPANELVAVVADGSQQVRALWSGSDFVMTPRVSPDGSMLAWIAWDHPNMGWDATRLHVHRFGDGELEAEILVLGQNSDRSLCEPGWDLDAPARLLVCSDHDDWWGLYQVDLASGSLRPVVVGEFDVATPPWVFGMQRWGGRPRHAGSCSRTARWRRIGGPGRGGCGVRLRGERRRGARREPQVRPCPCGRRRLVDLVADRWPRRPDGAPVLAYAGAGYRHETEVAALSIDSDGHPERGTVRPARDLGLDPGLLVEPEAITFPTGPGGAAVAHALYYPPANPACAGPLGERPPLLVMAHGGPTSAARRQLQLGIAYWTSRGIAVVDVDYRGSTGYGRRYRRALDGAWGVADVEDCVAAAKFLADRGDVDPERLMIRGGSAGGFTVLAALAFHDTFAAGASRYGIADLEALTADTHKFESRYLDTLVGPYPEARDTYRARSPIHHLDGFDEPMIVLQGDEDEIVPPAQAEMIVEALEAKGVLVSYLLFEGEQHGFRNADNIVKALEAEFAFFGKILGFIPADNLPELEITGL